MGLKVITAPTDEQISLAQALLHLRADEDGDTDAPEDHPDADWLNGVGIPAARQYCEEWLGRSLAPVVLELALDAFPTERSGFRANDCTADTRPIIIELPMAPVSVLTSVKYLDGDGAEQTLPTDAYTFDDYSAVPRVVLLSGTSWPATKTVPNAVKVRYTAGYDLEADSPQTHPLPYAIRAAMLLVLGHLWENREASVVNARGSVGAMELPLGVQSLLRPYQLRLSLA